MGKIKALVRVAVLSIVFPLLIFPAAGHWDWAMAWAVTFLMVVGAVGSRLLILRKHPELLEERASSVVAEDSKSWDRFLAPLMAFTPALVLIFAGFDERFDWSPQIPLFYEIVGLCLIAAGYGLGTWAMLANQYFSGLVRIQSDRDHRVADGGPYAHVRHPGYTASVLGCVGFPLALSSLWAFALVALFLVVVVFRTLLEDQTLQEELPGYSEFVQKVEFRLIPWVW